MRILLLLIVLCALLAGIWGGWIRTGWAVPYTALAVQHGALMVNGFLATLIFFERAVTFKKKWVLLLPAIQGLCLVFFALSMPAAAQYSTITGAAGFCLMCAYFTWKYRELYYYVFCAGGACLLAGNFVLLHGTLYANAVGWWMGFLLLTIVAERLELSRFLALRPLQKRLLLGCLLLVCLSYFLPGNGGRWVMAAGLAATAAWLLRYDMARLAIRAPGAHRYAGLLLLAGYAWLPVTAWALVAGAQLPFQYDAVVHSFFIGFVFSMIFSHAPVILPAVVKLPIQVYRPFLYVPFCLLQLSLVLRIRGDVAGSNPLRKWGAMGNGISMLLFFGSIIFIVLSALRKRKISLKA